MKTKSILILATGLLVSTGLTFAQAPGSGRSGQPRGTCGNVCDGQGFMNKGKGGGNGGGARQGRRDGSGKGAGQQKRDRKRDGSGPGCRQGT